MTKPFAWTCPYCQQNATITSSNFEEQLIPLNKDGKHGLLGFSLAYIVCPNSDCKEYELLACLNRARYNPRLETFGGELSIWNLRPESSAKPMPSYVPSAIVEDYKEACLVRNLSPKASATLARRCLQGIIRDFHQVKPANLFNEINEIKDKVDAVTWAGIDAVRKVGNIGAHMEKDVDVIIDVEPEEAQLLIGLIETLIKEWYVARHDRKQAMDALVKLAADKDAAKKPQTSS
ncbi:DUF4145 domain-containing protein [Luteibacter sp. CQ10]|uniref:DUF4145 domain-containing protein n=1 Tax=Luteibacter sp. CQ10 TaxID=2805821 RepID=UPI0034A0FA02